MKKNLSSKRVLMVFCIVLLVAVVTACSANKETAPTSLQNGGFESDIWADGNGWTVEADSWEGGNTVAADNNYVNSGENAFHFWFEKKTSLHLTQSVSLQAGSYDVRGLFHGEGATPQINISDSSSSLASESVKLQGWGNWVNGKATFNLTSATTVKISIDIDVEPDGWGNIDDITLEPATPDDPENDGSKDYNKVKVEAVEGLSPDFMLGVDVSSVIALEDAGIKFKNQEGEEEDFFKLLKDSGVNTIRVRIWNDPFDSEGKSYGGGNNDINTAVKIAKRAAENGLKLYVDFHYSDFWAAPNKQEKPKAWRGLSTSEICDAMKIFTTESLAKLKETGVDIPIVQVGNETSGYFLGTKNWATMSKYFKAGANAVKAFDPDIKVMIQFGGSDNVARYDNYCAQLKKYGVPYDIVGASWYPCYKSSGTASNLTKNLNNIITKYKKEVMVVENAYPTSFDDYDGQGNNFSFSNYRDQPTQFTWEVSPQGQAQEVRDVIALVNELKNGMGTGYCYWEPAWITVGDTSNLSGDAWQAQYDKNFETWETYGCGWASSHAKGYYTTANYADTNNGGSSWENMAMFDQTGRAYDSLNVFKYVYTGSDGDDKPYVTAVDIPEIIIKLSDGLSESDIWNQIWWNRLECTYSDASIAWVDVKWISEEGNTITVAYSKGSLGTYDFHGVVADFRNTLVNMKVTIAR